MPRTPSAIATSGNRSCIQFTSLPLRNRATKAAITEMRGGSALYSILKFLMLDRWREAA